MSVLVPILSDGSGAADGGDITNHGGYAHNGAECSIIQTDDGVTGSVIINDYVLGMIDLAKGVEVNGKASWVYDYFGEDITLSWDGASWVYDSVASLDTWTHPTDTGSVPPKTGWVVSDINGYTAIAPDYSQYFGGASFWGDGSSWTAKSYQDLRDHPNGDLNLFLKCVCIDGVPHYREIVQYDVNEVFSDE